MTRIPTLVFAGALGALALSGCAPYGLNRYGTAGQPDTVATTPTPGTSAPPVDDAPPKLTESLTATVVPRMGSVVTDEDGFVLYRFDNDTARPSKSNCAGKCAEIWPPALTDGNPALDGIAPDKVGVIMRDDGTRQLTIGNWPVYRYVGDLKPGQWKGQNVNGTWFVVTKDGRKNLTCLPKKAPPVAPPAPAQQDSGNSPAGY